MKQPTAFEVLGHMRNLPCDVIDQINTLNRIAFDGEQCNGDVAEFIFQLRLVLYSRLHVATSVYYR